MTARVSGDRLQLGLVLISRMVVDKGYPIRQLDYPLFAAGAVQKERLNSPDPGNIGYLLL